MGWNDICEHGRIVVALWIAETTLEKITDKDEDYGFCKEAVQLCWDWFIDGKVSHLLLYEKLSANMERSIADILFEKEDIDPEQYYGTISECVAYITWQAFDRAGEHGYPEDLEECETGNEHFEGLINELLGENVVEQNKYESLLRYLKENDCNIVLLSADDTKMDSQGNEITFYEGMPVSIYSDDVDEDGKADNLVAEGTAIRLDLSQYPAWKHVKWCCRIDEKGIMNESDLQRDI